MLLVSSEQKLVVLASSHLWLVIIGGAREFTSVVSN